MVDEPSWSVGMSLSAHSENGGLQAITCERSEKAEKMA